MTPTAAAVTTARATAPTFVPATVTPPRQRLRPVAWFATAARNVIETLDEALFDLPYRTVSWGGMRAAIVLDPALVEEVLLHKADAFGRGRVPQRLFRSIFPQGLLTVEGEVWRSQRRAAAPGFRAAMLDAHVPVMAQGAERAAAELSSGGAGPTDVSAAMTSATFRIIREVLLAGDASSVSEAAMTGAVTAFMETGARLDPILIMGWNWLPRPGARKAREAVQTMRAGAQAALHARREGLAAGEAHQDLLQLLLDARDPETGAALTEEELIDNILTFINAGHETTALALTWSLYLIANSPTIQEALAAEAQEVIGAGAVGAEHLSSLALHERVIKEAMRLYPPAAFMSRAVVRPVQVGPLTLEPGTAVTIPIYVMHRSRRYWENPEAFDPDRFLPERSEGRHRMLYMPFGGGARICIGARFAMMEATAVLATLTRRLRFSPNPAHKIMPRFQITLRPDGGMPLYVERRLGANA